MNTALDFQIVHQTEEYIYIVDVGAGYWSVTNNAEKVLRYLIEHHQLGSRRLIYRDSEGQIDEILHDNGRFLDFAPGHRGIEKLPEWYAIF